MPSGYRVILVQITVDVGDDETYEQATERIQRAIDQACPDGWRGVLSEAFEPIGDVPDA